MKLLVLGHPISKGQNDDDCINLARLALEVCRKSSHNLVI